MNYQIKKFNDGQVSATIVDNKDLNIKVRGNSYEELFAVASVKEAWDAKNAIHKNATATLTLWCLIGQRSDRRFNAGESFDLKIIANFINSMNFDKVYLLHPHSDISTALIESSEVISHFKYVEKAFKTLKKPVLISPDAGAYKATYKIAEKLGSDLIPANKVRLDGVPHIHIQGNVQDKECLIIDDLADGGRTFKHLADALKSQGASKVFLYVTHGQFNYGFSELKESIDHIYCTNSYKDINDSFITQYSVFE